MLFAVKVNNVPKTCTEQFIVARYCVMDNELWYWGAFNELNKARQTASEVEGVVIEQLPYKKEV